MTTAKNRVTIIADDLTGALDASGFLAGGGLTVTVYPGRVFELTGDVSVINTGSRGDPASVAIQKVRAVVPKLKGKTIFKKIDSTLRGNVAAEIITLLDTLSFAKAIIAPAFPSPGRTVVDGILLVDGVPVAATGFARDPLNPVKESFIPALFERAAGHQAGTVALEDVARGPEHLARVFGDRKERILVCDAVTQEHLRAIVRAAAPRLDRLLLVGSGGLTREIGLFWEKRPAKYIDPGTPEPGPALLVVGSRHPASARQLIVAQRDSGLALLSIDTAGRGGPTVMAREMGRLVGEAILYLSAGKPVAVTSAFSPLACGRVRDVAAALAEVAGLIMAQCKVGGLLLSGGDTAEAVCARLGVTAIRVAGEIQAGIPAGEITLGAKRVRLVTKAGGFGGEKAISDSLPYLERGAL